MMVKKVSPAAVHALKEALAVAFWYKNELRGFISVAIEDPVLIGRLDWTQNKHTITQQLVDHLLNNQPKTVKAITDLMIATVEIGDPVHLKKLDDNGRQYERAVTAIAALETHIGPFRAAQAEQDAARLAQAAADAKAELGRATSDKLASLKVQFYEIVALAPQQRGYKFEGLLTELFALYDIDAKGPFRINGEQIDGAFTFDGTEFILEAKWEKDLTPLSDLDTFAGKVGRKLDNTLGLFVAVTGFQPNAIAKCSDRRSVFILMDGADLTAVLDDRIALPELLSRKKQHASRTGEVMLSAFKILG